MSEPSRKRKRISYASSPRPMQIDRPLRRPRYKSSSVEKKWFDTALAATTLDGTGVVLSPSINLVNEGNGVNEMAGRKIVITRIQLRAIVIKTSSSQALINNLDVSSEYRVAIVLDRQCNGAAPTIANIFQDNDIRTYNNLSQSRRFKILKEEQGCITAGLTYNNATSVYASPIARKELIIYLKCWYPIMYTDQAGGSRAITEILSNNIAIVGHSTSSTCTVQYRARIRFQDN